MLADEIRLSAQVEKYYKDNVVFVKKGKPTKKALTDFIKRKNNKFVIVDLETTDLDLWSPTWFARFGEKPVLVDRVVPFSVQLGLYNEKKDKLHCVFVPVWEKGLMKLVHKILHNPKLQKVGHNIKYDISAGINSKIMIKDPAWDTLVGTRLTHDREPSHKLEDLARVFGFRPLKDEDD